MKELKIIEQNGIRVLTTAQLAEAYGTEAQILTNNFNRNKERYEIGKHYICLEGEYLKEFKTTNQNDVSLVGINKLYLWTEKGILLHAKSLNTDKAWEAYDMLIETYFKAKELQANLQDLSPELRLLINLETEQKRHTKLIADINEKIDGIKDVVSLNPENWRSESKKLIAKIANSRGGFEYIREVNNDIYAIVNQRGGVNLDIRLLNKKQRMALEGVSKSNIDKISRVDVIADDKKLIEIYLSIVKDMAIKSGINVL